MVSLRLALPVSAALLALTAVPALAQNGPNGDVPYAGADLGYDYLTGEYYRYDGPAPQDPRAREQTGFRDGYLHTAPRTWYYSGVRWLGSGYGYGCRCRNIWYGRHYPYTLNYYRDEMADIYGRVQYDQHSYRTGRHYRGEWGW